MSVTLKRLARSIGWLAGLAGVGLAGLPAAESEATPEAKPVIRIGIQRDLAPLSFADAEGLPAGFTADLLREAERIGGFKVEMTVDWWRNTYRYLTEGHLHAIAPIINTPERRSTLDFSITYMVSHAVVYLRPDQPKMTRTADFRGKRIGSLLGTVALTDALAHPEWGATIIRFDSGPKLLEATSRGECDAALFTSVRSSLIVDELGLRKEFIDDITYNFRFAVRKGDSDKLALLNEALAQLKHNETYDRLYARWIGPIEPRRIRLNDLRPYFLPASLLAFGVVAAFLWQRKNALKLARNAAALAKSRHELETINRRLAAIFDNASSGILYTDAHHHIERVNQRMCTMLGYPAAELAKLDYPAFTQRDDAARVAAGLEEIRAGRSDGFKLEQRFVRHDGSELWVNLGVTVIRDADTSIHGFVAVADDITARRQALELLEKFKLELEQRVAARTSEVESLINSIPDTVLICDSAGAIVNCHPPRAEDMPAFLQDGCFDADGRCSHPLLVDVAAEMCAKVRKQAGTVVTETARNVAGATFWVEVRGSFIDQTRVLILVRDISARKQVEFEVQANLERARELVELKSRFVSVASHEFRTPLAGAVSNVDLLERYGPDIDPGKRRLVIERLKRAHGRLTNITDDILAVGRAEAGRTSVTPVEVDLDRFVQEVIRESEQVDQHRHSHLYRREGGSSVVQTDPKLLHYILSNLLSNAARYSPAGSAVSVTLALHDDHYAVVIADQGIGIPAPDRARLFEPFVRGSNVGEIGGTGLGLNIVKRYTELLNGRVELVPSAVGATFRVQIPHQRKAS
jgi:PAS domain S-box-containing protein